MCGIAGVMYFDRRDASMDQLRAMGDAISHRGPDAEGFHTGPGIGLVHRRLSIIDLAGGAQPQSNEDETIHTVFNGEIYNYRELRSQLVGRGHEFDTQSDTETLVHLYEDDGANLAARLRGMFAFAIWDEKRARLTLGRDRVGQKPLYYFVDNEKIVFASEIKALRTFPDFPNRLNLQSLDLYFTLGMVPGPRSIYRNVHKVPPGHVATIGRDGNLDLKCYWSYRPAVCDELSPNHWKDAVHDKINETVNQHLVSDVPVGCFLSGGIDSTIVSAVATRQNAAPLQTFSIGFGDGHQSELPLAKQTAELLGGPHREQTISANAAADLEHLVRVYDEPFADSSAIPTLKVAELASEHVKVVLSGDGGDECFGGYSRYVADLREARMRGRIPAWIRALIVRPVASAWPQTDWLPRYLRGKSFLTNISSQLALAYAQTISNSDFATRNALYSQDVQNDLGSWHAETTLASNFEINEHDPLAGMLAADFNCLLPDAFLAKVDRASMAFGLEVRPPLVDHELIELAARIPSDLKVHGSETKWIMKQAMKDDIPKHLANRGKQGFDIPLDAWLRGPLSEVFRETALASNQVIATLVDQKALTRVFEQHLAGTRRCGQLLWNHLVLASWLARYRPEI